MTVGSDHNDKHQEMPGGGVCVDIFTVWITYVTYTCSINNKSVPLVQEMRKFKEVNTSS